MVVVWGGDLSFFLRSGAEEVRSRWRRGNGERKGGGCLGRRKWHFEGSREKMRVIRVLAGWEVSILVNKHSCYQSVRGSGPDVKYWLPS